MVDCISGRFYLKSLARGWLGLFLYDVAGSEGVVGGHLLKVSGQAFFICRDCGEGCWRRASDMIG